MIGGTAELRRVRARVQGRVQGVGFRAMTQYEAGRLGLSGWVRNLVDGDVELEAEGPAEKIETFLHHLRQGPGMARVDNLVLEWIPPLSLPQTRFEVRPTG